MNPPASGPSLPSNTAQTLVLLGLAGLLVLYVLLAGPSLERSRILPAALVTLAFAAAAWLLRGVTLSGAAAGALVAFLIYLTAGLGGFLALLAVFLLTFASTRFGYARKQRLGAAEPRGGRDALQVAANLYAAALVLVPTAGALDPQMFFVAAMAVLAEAAADTVSSEIGQALSPRAYLITNLRPVAPGTDGGISAVGTLAGALAAVAIAIVSRAAGVIESRWVPAVWLAAIFGMLLDSVLGAVFERRGRLGNNAVNALSTAAAGALALWLAAA